MNIEDSQKLLTERYNGDEHKKDIHEADVNFLMKCEEAAQFVMNSSFGKNRVDVRVLWKWALQSIEFINGKIKEYI